jgi:hypothetical protein
MKADEEARHRRNVVSSMYDNDTWHERVAHMPPEQVTAIYLRFIRNPIQPRPATPEALDIEINKDRCSSYSELRLF